MPGNDDNANAPAATGASKMLAMLPKITKWATSGDANNALSSRNRSSSRAAARINFIMTLTALSISIRKVGFRKKPLLITQSLS